MTKRITWREVIDLLEIEPFELFDLMRQGRLQPYSRYGKKIIDCDSLERAPKDSYEKVETNVRARQHADTLGAGSGVPPRSEWEIEQIAHRIHESQSLDIVNPPKDCILMSFSLPLNGIEAEKRIKQARGYLFKEDEVLRVRKELLTRYTEAPMPNLDEFVRSLRIFHESDSEVKIQKPGEKPVIHYCETMGFKHDKTGEWKTFLRIFQEPRHTFRFGQAYQYNDAGKKQSRNKDYENRYRMYRRINKKLVQFLNKQFDVELPENFKLYEECPEEKSGTYKFKFKVVGPHEMADKSRFWGYPRDRLLNTIKNLAEEITIYENTQRTIASEQREYFIEASHTALKRGWITEQELAEIRPDAPPNEKPTLGEF